MERIRLEPGYDTGSQLGKLREAAQDAGLRRGVTARVMVRDVRVAIPSGHFSTERLTAYFCTSRVEILEMIRCEEDGCSALPREEVQVKGLEGIHLEEGMYDMEGIFQSNGKIIFSVEKISPEIGTGQEAYSLLEVL